MKMKGKITIIFILNLLFLHSSNLVCGMSKNIPKIITSKVFLDHRPVSGSHPECPERIASFLDELLLADTTGLPYLVQPPTAVSLESEYIAARDMIKKTHDYQYIKQVYTASQRGYPSVNPFDTDTYIHPTTFQTCIYAQSAWMNAIDVVMQSKMTAFALTRPPGHHATYDQSMGFCIFNFAIGAAHYAIEKYQLERIGIIDFDVHYGNGIADLMKKNPKIRYTSLHQEEIFPSGRGRREEKGELNNIKNIPLPAGTRGKEYLPLFEEEAVSFIKDFQPQLVIVSAGYDALQSDELAELSLIPSDYYQIGVILRKHFGDSIAFGLEGGYNLQDTPLAIKETLKAFT